MTNQRARDIRAFCCNSKSNLILEQKRHLNETTTVGSTSRNSIPSTTGMVSVNIIKLLNEDITDEINDSGGFFQLVGICSDKLRPLVGFCTIFLALF